MIENSHSIPPGSVVEGPTFGPDDERRRDKRRGILLQYDDSDDSILIIHPVDDSETEWDFTWLHGEGAVDISSSAEGLALRRQFPIHTEHVFVVEAEGPDGPVIELYASPAAVADAHPDVEDLRTRIMEAVADPGERVYLDGEVYLSFRSIQGEIA